jgi:hypothetical protein
MKYKETYTEWRIKYPWHVSNEPYPKDKDGNCTCDCKYCIKYGVHTATREAHMQC